MFASWRRNGNESGTPLRHENRQVLALKPGTTWKTQDVADVYESLAAKHGAPRTVFRAVLCDGATELRDAANVLRPSRPDVIVLGDFKHRAADMLKSVDGGDPRFAARQTHLGQTRSAIQQTELAHVVPHFVPPGVRPKARFLNIAPTLRWAATRLWLLDTPDANGRAAITAERLEDQPGWLRPFAADSARWSACQQVVSTGLTFLNEQGLFRGAADRFRELVTDSCAAHAAGRGRPRRRRTSDLVPARGRVAAGRRRTPAAQHRDSGIELRPLQTTGTTTLEERLHEPDRHLRLPAASGHPPHHPRSL